MEVRFLHVSDLAVCYLYEVFYEGWSLYALVKNKFNINIL